MAIKEYPSGMIPSVSGQSGKYLTTNGSNLSWGTALGGINSNTNFVATSQTTTSTNFTDLATVQSITLTTGTKVLVLLSANTDNSAAGGYGNISVAVSGATTRAATDADGLFLSGYNTSSPAAINTTHVYLTCTAGSNTFTMKFKSDGGTETFANRRMTVIDLGS